MKISVPQSQARLFGRAGESVTRSDRRGRELWLESTSPPLTARPNGRRDSGWGWPVETSPRRGAPNEHENHGQTLTPVGHPFMTPPVRRFAPKTVRQDWNAVRQELERVSDRIGIRTWGHWK
jgi:hypothetical protein